MCVCVCVCACVCVCMWPPKIHTPTVCIVTLKHVGQANSELSNECGESGTSKENMGRMREGVAKKSYRLHIHSFVDPKFSCYRLGPCILHFRVIFHVVLFLVRNHYNINYVNAITDVGGGGGGCQATEYVQGFSF